MITGIVHSILGVGVKQWDVDREWQV